ncbi:MAG: pilus assembly protein [Anaerolineales bacterium]|nr:pilus assembly protein [Anaerolineales bacterium]
MKLFKTRSQGKNRGQSFVELAIVLPLLLFLLIGFVEVGAIIYNYLSLLDMVREAARFAADRDPEVLNGDMSSYPQSACADDALHYYLDTACVIIGSNFNPYIYLNPATDDVAISIFTIDNNIVKDRKPNDGDGVWSLYSDNWTKNCDGTLRSTIPFMPLVVNDPWVAYTTPTFGPGTPLPGAGTIIPGGPTDKGIVLVEIYFCHEQLLNLPILSDLLPNPVPLHAFTYMPAPHAAPTPTPLP